MAYNWIDRFVPRNLTLEKCYICNQSLRGNPHWDYSGHYACEHHNTAFCFACYSICDTDQSISVPNYGWLCPKCAQKSIDPKAAIQLVQYVHQFYAKMGMAFPGHKLHLVNVGDMLALLGNDAAAVGLAFQKYQGVYRICVLQHLSKISFAGVFAHEILHLWQYGLKIDAPLPLCEGFCNLGQYLVLNSINKDEAMSRMNTMLSNPDLVYGEGFRIIKVIYDHQGWKGVLDAMYRFKKN